MSVTSLSHTIEITPGVTPTSHTCSECKKSMPGDAQRVTCSDKCRKRRERRQKDQHSAYIMALHELQKMRDGIKRGETVKDYRDQLIRLKDEINDLLLLANESNAVARREMLSGYHQNR